MRMKRLLPALAGIATIIAIWLLVDNTQYAGRGADGGTKPHGAADASTANRLQRRPQPSTPLPEGPFHAVRAELESRATTGDAEAAYRLGSVIGQCLSYEPIPMGAFIAIIAQAASYFGSTFRIAGRRIDDDLNLDAMLERKRELDHLCKGAGDLEATTVPGDAHTWILRAVALGHTAAMADYPDHAFSEFATHADLLDNADEVVRRRERAKALIRRAFEAGEPKALHAYARAYAPEGILQEDPVRALAYWNAYRQIATTGSATGKLVDAGLREGLSAAQIREAELLSSRILGTFHSAGNGR